MPNLVILEDCLFVVFTHCCTDINLLLTIHTTKVVYYGRSETFSFLPLVQLAALFCRIKTPFCRQRAFPAMERLLQTIRSYVPLRSEEDEIVRALFREKRFRKGDHLLKAGKVCRYVYYIDKGLVRYYIDSNGQERTNYFNKEGEFVCDYLSFLPQSPSGVSIQALEDATVYFISFADLPHMLVHGLTAVYMLVTSVLLFRGR